MTIIIYSIAKGTLKQEQQEKEIIIMILITDYQVTSFLDDRILSRKLINTEIEFVNPAENYGDDFVFERKTHF